MRQHMHTHWHYVYPDAHIDDVLTLPLLLFPLVLVIGVRKMMFHVLQQATHDWGMKER